MIVTIPFDILKIENDGFHLLICGEICNIPVNMIIDTGASKTVFDLDFIEKVFENKDIIPNEKESVSLSQSNVKSSQTIIPSFKIGELKFLDFNATLLDLSQINKSYREMGFPYINGILGSDLLVGRNAIINFKEKLLLLDSVND
ncbi:MAG: aspartyl protease family protein [Bacteroidetes bacterium]|nr:aspartyl protease family protein [Bacteroidota bacterium]